MFVDTRLDITSGHDFKKLRSLNFLKKLKIFFPQAAGRRRKHKLASASTPSPSVSPTTSPSKLRLVNSQPIGHRRPRALNHSRAPPARRPAGSKAARPLPALSLPASQAAASSSASASASASIIQASTQPQQQWESDSRAKFYLFCRPHAGSSAARAQRNRYSQLERALASCAAAASAVSSDPVYDCDCDGDGAPPLWSTGNASLTRNRNAVEMQQQQTPESNVNGGASSALAIGTARLLQQARVDYERAFQRASRELDFSRTRSFITRTNVRTVHDLLNFIYTIHLHYTVQNSFVLIKANPMSHQCLLVLYILCVWIFGFK